ncbi:MAG: GAF domain-containing protein [Rhizobiales bacterium]|nr:GAF domain-containing protein [Hyphomicrobiales bacterium]
MALMIEPTISELLVRERDILTRIAAGGPLEEILRDLVLMVEQPSHGEMLASVLFLSPDRKHLLEGAAPSLPKEYNAAIHGAEIGPRVGSCGTAAYTGEPVIVSDIATSPLWDDFRSIALKHNLRACWSIPIKAADGSVLGTFANYYREPREPTGRDLEVISMVARTTGIAIERHRNELARKREEEQRTLLLHELNHRVKNVFALASSLVALSASSAADSKELATAVRGRLDALARAHQLVRPGFSDVPETNASSVSFRQVLNDILAPYVTADIQNRVTLAGPDFVLRPEAITGVALVLHELATNAMKYGCLHQPNGVLSVTWFIENGSFHLAWGESGIPYTRAPAVNGFGTTLTKRTIEDQFGGAIRYDWRSDGPTVTIDAPLEAIADGHA